MRRQLDRRSTLCHRTSYPGERCALRAVVVTEGRTWRTQSQTPSVPYGTRFTVSDTAPLAFFFVMPVKERVLSNLKTEEGAGGSRSHAPAG